MKRDESIPAHKILFLCHGNICRSPMAEFVMKELVRRAGRDDIVVESAALHTDEIGNDIHYGTRRKLLAEGIPFAPRRAWLLNAAKAREYDLLIGMDDYNMADLRRLVFPEDAGKRSGNCCRSPAPNATSPTRGTPATSTRPTPTSLKAARRF